MESVAARGALRQDIKRPRGNGKGRIPTGRCAGGAKKNPEPGQARARQRSPGRQGGPFSGGDAGKIFSFYRRDRYSGALRVDGKIYRERGGYRRRTLS